MDSINEVGSREKEKKSVFQWVAIISLVIWIVSSILLDVFDYEKGPEFYLFTLGIVLVWVWFIIKTEEPSSKSMKIGAILVFAGLIGLTLLMYFIKSFTISVLATMLNQVILILVISLIVILVGICLVCCIPSRTEISGPNK